jgi:hypothetical protein
MKLSRSQVERLIIAELRQRFPGAIPVTIDYDISKEAGFCHCWWVEPARQEQGTPKGKP